MLMSLVSTHLVTPLTHIDPHGVMHQRMHALYDALFHLVDETSTGDGVTEGGGDGQILRGIT